VNYDLSFVVTTITVICYSWARSSGDHLLKFGTIYRPPHLLPQCEALRTCRSGFPIATKWCCDQDVKDVPGAAFRKRNKQLFMSLWRYFL